MKNILSIKNNILLIYNLFQKYYNIWKNKSLSKTSKLNNIIYYLKIALESKQKIEIIIISSKINIDLFYPKSPLKIEQIIILPKRLPKRLNTKIIKNDRLKIKQSIQNILN